MTISDTCWIDAPIETVWSLTLDVTELPAISPTTMSSVELLDAEPLAPGSRVRIKQPRQRARIWTVETIAQPHTFGWSTTLGPLRLRATHRLTSAAKESGAAGESGAAVADGAAGRLGTRNELTLELTGPGQRLATALLGPTMRRALAAENAGFTRAAEAAERA